MKVDGIYRLADDTMVRKEPFGFVMAFPDGEMDFYSDAAAPLVLKAVNQKVEKAEFDAFLTTDLRDPNNPDWDFNLNHPFMVTLEMTRECNCHCEFCFISAGEPRPNELSAEELRGVWKQIADLKPFCVQLTGGEPFLHPMIMEAIEFFHSRGIALGMGTNGVLLTREIIKQLPKKDFGFTISIDSFMENDKIRGNLASFELLKEKINWMKEEGLNFGILATLSKLNIHSVLPLIQWCRDNDVLFDTVEAHAVGKGAENSHHMLDETDLKQDLIVYRAKEEAEDYYESRNDFLGRFFSGFMVLGYRFNSMIKRCKGSRAWIYITSNGSVYPCSNCAATDIYQGGNLREQSLESIWTGGFKEMRALSWADYSDCESCEMGKAPFSCYFRCPALSYSNTGELNKPGCTEYLKRSLKLRTYVHTLMHKENEKKEVSNAR